MAVPLRRTIPTPLKAAWLRTCTKAIGQIHPEWTEEETALGVAAILAVQESDLGEPLSAADDNGWVM